MNMERTSTGTMKARLAMQIDADALKAKYGSDFDPNKLRWAYWNGERWMEVPSTLTNGVLVAETDHFSTWTIVDATPEAAPDYTWYYAGGALVAVATVVAVFLLRGRK